MRFFKWVILVAAIVGIENVATAQKKVTVELWNWLPEYERQFWDKAAEQFNARQKDGVIEMKYQEVGFLDLPVKFYRNLSSQPDALPDILSIEFNQWPIYTAEKAGGLSDLTSLTNKPNAPFSAAFQEEYTFGGKKYAVSFQASPFVFAYNKTIFEKEGYTEPLKTWERFVEASEALSKKGIYLGYDVFDFQTWYGMFLQRGGNLVDAKGNVVLGSHYEDATAAFELLKRMYKAGKQGYSTPNFVNGSHIKDFQSGKLAGVLGGDWLLPILKRQLPEQAGQWRLQPVPGWGKGYTGVATGGTGYSLAAKSGRSAEETKLIRNFLEFAVLSTQMQAVYYKETLLQMTNLQIVNNHAVIQLPDPYFGGQKLAADLREQIKDMAVRRSLTNQDQLVKVFNTGIEAYFSGKLSGAELFERMVKAASAK
jgi:ABC-type glycerol-3-phosphate transport system substrate-binding protein